MENHLQHLPGRSEPFTMIAVKGGRFDMGGESWNTDSLPAHPVELDEFWIGQYLVTQALWIAVLGEGSNSSKYRGSNRPVETVSWDVINQEFLPQLNKITLDSRPTGTGYRLPTEAEWEYAACGGQSRNEKTYMYAGSNRPDEAGWYDENSHDETKPVGLKLPNELGIFDMSGNVWEWCADWFGSDYYQKCLHIGLVKNPKGPEIGMLRVTRGGSRIDDAPICSTVYRSSNMQMRRDSYIGFRLVLSALPV